MAQIDAGEMALDLEDVARRRPAGRRRRALGGRGRGAPASSIVVDCPDDVGVIRGDARRLGQILDHLVENALAPDARRRARSPSPPARRWARSSCRSPTPGRGIPFHVQAHIFDRFVGRERGGPGLGLALVKALTELHGGWVALESEPGAGATFTCHLPEEAQAARRPAGAGPAGLGE